jgi:hypothetical protein
MNITRGFAAAAFLVLLAGCSTQEPLLSKIEHHPFVRVDSYARADAAQFRTFKLIPGSDDVAANQLRFEEMATQVARILEAHGLVEWKEGGGVLDLAIMLSWMEPRQFPVTRSGVMPIYGQIGGGITYNNSVSYIYGQAVPSSGTSYTPPVSGIVGSAPFSQTTYYYRGDLSLEAYEAQPVLLANRANRPVQTADMKQVWTLDLWAVFHRPIEPRVNYPTFLRTVGSYVGKSSGGQVDVPIGD